LVNGISNNATPEHADDVFTSDVSNHAESPRGISNVTNHTESPLNVTNIDKNGKGRTAKKHLKRQTSVGSAHDIHSELESYLPLKPEVKTRSRSASAWNLCTGSKSKPSITPRENKSSIKRKQLQQPSCASIDEQMNAYMTPFQRKEHAIQDLRRDLEESHEKLREKDEEIQHIVSERNVELSVVLAGKDAEIHSLREQGRILQEECVKLMEEQDKLKDDRDDLKLKNKEMEVS
jgi:hypothetical protein